VIALVLTGFVVTSALPARADVLVSAPKEKACFQAGIKVGVWYQEYSGGPKWFDIHIIRKSNGKLVWSKSGMATAAHWKYWTYYPDWIGKFRVVYTTAAGNTKFVVLRYGCE
jgi:hypothetical protein